VVFIKSKNAFYYLELFIFRVIWNFRRWQFHIICNRRGRFWYQKIKKLCLLNYWKTSSLWDNKKISL